ncbi:MAG TPA: AAA family ATPase, partial [Polyangiales bacterium]|nr:AAA family ATPase [Polyangiales bacterium]
ALAEVHRHGLVHRDLKPANVLLDARGQPRLIDFGLATRVGDGGPAQGALVGSLNYMAPEQSGALERTVDGRADLYSLGVVLFECATGHVPFVAAEAAELIRMHATVPAADLRRVREDLSPAFALLVAKLLAKDPDDRHASAELLAAELRRLEAMPPAERLTTSLTFAGQLAPIPSFDFATLFGREAELELLYSAHDRAQRGHCGIVLVAGPAGQGKSHLVQAFVHDRAGGGLMRAKCDQGESVPLGPLRRALSAYLVQNLDAGGAARRAHVVQSASAVVAQLCPQEAPRFGIEQRAPSIERDDELLEDVVSLLLELARAAQPLVIWIDDVQWLDSASQRVLYRLANESAHAPLLCIATVRDGERERELVRTLSTQATEIVHIELAPLGADSVRRILRQMLCSSNVGDDVVEKLHERSRGSPFSLRQYTRALLDAGGLTPAWGSWQLDPQALELLPLPDDVLDLVLARIGELGADTKQVLQSAAVLGQSFRFELLRELTRGLPVELCLHQALSRELVVRA